MCSASCIVTSNTIGKLSRRPVLSGATWSSRLPKRCTSCWPKMSTLFACWRLKSASPGRFHQAPIGIFSWSTSPRLATSSTDSLPRNRWAPMMETMAILSGSRHKTSLQSQSRAYRMRCTAGCWTWWGASTAQQGTVSARHSDIWRPKQLLSACKSSWPSSAPSGSSSSARSNLCTRSSYRKRRRGCCCLQPLRLRKCPPRKTSGLGSKDCS
mmetsp:Transcript_34657/g.83727  ORF Transcript_34657/g.83727 Transcript_34657/m.83727 type:complete len:212 (+) Transcript_34657:666-1301(+)